MKLQTVKSEGLAHNSYYFSDNGEAVVIDPRRDCEISPSLQRQNAQKSSTFLKLTETKTML
jgi:hydroxyacylglutathione hydrolase